MRLLGVSTRDKKKFKEPTLVDFLQFVDAVVEVHGDPFYELRYRYGPGLRLCVCESSHSPMFTLAAPHADICSV